MPFETIVLNELERRKAEVGYVRTREGLEVDFLVRQHGGDEELVQVCADLSTAGTFNREVSALTAAASEHPRATRRLLVLDREQAMGVVGQGVIAQPAYEWLLDAVPHA